MKPLLRRPILTVFLYSNTGPSKPSRNLFQIAPFSTAASHNNPFSYQSRRHEDDSRNVKVSVWWDFENCALPDGVNVFRVSRNITDAIRAKGIKGPIQITAFGDIVQLPRPNQEALSSTGINLTHVPNGGKSSADRSLLVDLMYWVSQNPPPAHLFLITGDTEFAGILHRLRMNNYNILLASPENASGVLYSASSIMWQWNALLRGEDLAGKHFNHPPDGPHGSWYGHYKAPLEDPFSAMERPNPPNTEDPSDSNSDSKPRPIPKAVMKYVRNVLASNPKGISITDLRAELAKGNLSIEKDLYGYKKFSRFLLAMPNILKLQAVSSGQYLVQSVIPKSSEQNECSSGVAVESITNAGKSDSNTVHKSNDTKSSISEGTNKISLPTPYSVRKMETPSSKLQESQKVEDLRTKVQHSLPKVQQSVQDAQLTSGVQVPQGDLHAGTTSSAIQTAETEASGNQLHTAEDAISTPKQGLFKRLWKKLFGNKEHDANEENCSSSDNIPAKQMTIKEPGVRSTCQSESLKGLDASPSGDEPKVDYKTPLNSQATVDKSNRGSGFINQIKNWCSWKSLPPQSNSNLECDEAVAQKKPGSSARDIFSEGSFWTDMEAFLDTKQGSTLVLQSRTRLQLSQNLQQHGPPALRSLCESDLLHLVDLLISDKKCVEEHIKRSFPFKPSLPAAKAANNASSSSAGLRSVFLKNEQPTNSPNMKEKDGEKKNQNPPHSGVSKPVTQRSSSGKSRSEILDDCLKLVQEIVKKHPEGYNLGSFRKLFLEKYGYSLDIQKLGYQKLVNLLQVMPGIRIESNYIVPSSRDLYRFADELHSQESKAEGSVSCSDSERPDPSRNVDDGDSPWAELGPVSKTTPKKDETEQGSSSRMDYEPLSDDDLSDMDEENFSAAKPESTKPKPKEEESSLLQILDSWYGRKEDSNGNSTSENVPQNNVKPSSSSELTCKSDIFDAGKRSKPSKAYSFVSDHHGEHKDELINGILSSLNKSGEKSVEPKT